MPWFALVALPVLAGASPQAIEVSADDPALAAAAVKSLSLQYPAASVALTPEPQAGLLRVSIRRLEGGQVLIVATRGRATVMRTLTMDTPAGNSLDLGETVALAVPELLATLASVPSKHSVQRPAAAAAAKTEVEISPAEAQEPSSVPEPAVAVVRPSVEEDRTEVDDEARLAVVLAPSVMWGPGAPLMPGFEGELSFVAGRRCSFRLNGGFYFTGVPGRSPAALVPVDIQGALATHGVVWSVLLGFGPTLLVLIDASQADFLPGATATVEVNRRLGPRVELGVRLSATAVLSRPELLSVEGRPVGVAPLLARIGLTLSWAESPP